MGTVNSKDTRRISFDNKVVFNNSIIVPKSIEDDKDLDIHSLTADTEINDETILNETKVKEVPKEELEVDYWANRIDYLKKEHRLINSIIEREYEETLKNTNKLLEPCDGDYVKNDEIKPCLEWRSKIIKCYEDNAQKPLVCSPVVQAFSDCVTSCTIRE